MGRKFRSKDVSLIVGYLAFLVVGAVGGWLVVSSLTRWHVYGCVFTPDEVVFPADMNYGGDVVLSDGGKCCVIRGESKVRLLRRDGDYVLVRIERPELTSSTPDACSNGATTVMSLDDYWSLVWRVKHYYESQEEDRRLREAREQLLSDK